MDHALNSEDFCLQNMNLMPYIALFLWSSLSEKQNSRICEKNGGGGDPHNHSLQGIQDFVF